jgi:hypothetical protein
MSLIPLHDVPLKTPGTSRPVRITAETKLPLPCWQYGPFDDAMPCFWDNFNTQQAEATWFCDSPERPTCVPEDNWECVIDDFAHARRVVERAHAKPTPTAPDLPARLREAVATALNEAPMLKAHRTTLDHVLAAIAPFLPAPVPVTAPLPAGEGTPSDAIGMADDALLELYQQISGRVSMYNTETQIARMFELRGVLRDRFASLRTLLATAENLNTELQESNKRVLSDADELATKLATAEKERDEARRLVVSSFYEDEKPFFRQGVPTHELEEVVTAKQMDGLCEKIARLTPSASQSAEMERVEELKREVEEVLLTGGRYLRGAESTAVAAERLVALFTRHFTASTQ